MTNPSNRRSFLTNAAKFAAVAPLTVIATPAESAQVSAPLTRAGRFTQRQTLSADALNAEFDRIVQFINAHPALVQQGRKSEALPEILSPVQGRWPEAT